MAAATYRIGPSDFFSSADLEADAKTLSGQVAALDNEDWTAPAEDTFDSWWAFLSEWKTWYTDTFVNNWIGAGWNDSNRDQLIQYERRFLSFADLWQKQTGRQIGFPLVQVSSGSGDTLGAHLRDQLNPASPSFSWMAAAVALVVALIVWREFA
jgi:hypothetical protein